MGYAMGQVSGEHLVGQRGNKNTVCCSCVSCSRDVRGDVTEAFAALRWKRGKGPGGSTKMKLVSFEVVCSELCAHRLRKGAPGWLFQSLSLWLGPQAFVQYEELVSTYWVSTKLRIEVLPHLLHALRSPPRPTVVPIRPVIDDIIREARQALSGLDVLWTLPGSPSTRPAGPGLAAVGAPPVRKALEN